MHPSEREEFHKQSLWELPAGCRHRSQEVLNGDQPQTITTFDWIPVLGSSTPARQEASCRQFPGGVILSAAGQAFAGLSAASLRDWWSKLHQPASFERRIRKKDAVSTFMHRPHFKKEKRNTHPFTILPLFQFGCMFFLVGKKPLSVRGISTFFLWGRLLLPTCFR